MTDIVYVVKPGERNEELRYSLRSIANLPHDEVWIAGYTPTFVRNVLSIRRAASSSRFRDAEENLLAALLHPEVSDPFYLFNDDFYVMHYQQQIPFLHRGPLAALIEQYGVIRTSVYVRGMSQAQELLAGLGFSNPMSYEMHCPMLIDKAQMLHTLSLRNGIDCYHLRTVYGNLFGKGGHHSADVKVYKSDKQGIRDWEKMPLLSTGNLTFKYSKVGSWIRETLSEPSVYEHQSRANVL